MTAQTLPGVGYHRTATLSPDGVYRYELTRRWGTGREGVLWVMLNPSTADAEVDDQTIRKCIGFTRREGFDHLKVVNLYALRATNPAELDAHPDPVGPENFTYLARAMRDKTYPLAVAAWGANLGPKPLFIHVPWPPNFYRCLGVTKNGQPRHPSRPGYDTPLVPYTFPDQAR